MAGAAGDAMPPCRQAWMSCRSAASLSPEPGALSTAQEPLAGATELSKEHAPWLPTVPFLVSMWLKPKPSS